MRNVVALQHPAEPTGGSTSAERSQSSALTASQLRDRTTIALWPDCGRVLGLSKNSTYAAAKSGQIPTLRLGARYIVPVAKLLDLLGLLPEVDRPASPEPGAQDESLVHQ